MSWYDLTVADQAGAIVDAFKGRSLVLADKWLALAEEQKRLAAKSVATLDDALRMAVVYEELTVVLKSELARV